MDNVTVPTELDPKVLDDMLEWWRIKDYCGNKCNLDCRLVTYKFFCMMTKYFQAHPITTDTEKALNFYRAKAENEKPEWVPVRVNIKCSMIHGDGVIGPGAFPCFIIANLVFIESDGETIHVPPRKYTVLEWGKNEADNEG
jgi:hypothetical protein